MCDTDLPVRPQMAIFSPGWMEKEISFSTGSDEVSYEADTLVNEIAPCCGHSSGTSSISVATFSSLTVLTKDRILLIAPSAISTWVHAVTKVCNVDEKVTMLKRATPRKLVDPFWMFVAIPTNMIATPALKRSSTSVNHLWMQYSR